MKTVEDLKQNDIIYDINSEEKLIKYYYLCINPRNTNYHILIDASSDNPIKMYYETLQKILDKNLYNITVAKQALEQHRDEFDSQKHWHCSECSSKEYTDSVSEDDINNGRLSCSNCGNVEFYLR